VDKTSKLIIAIAAVAIVGLLIIDGKAGEAECGDAGYDQTKSICREGE
jgi:hypothetical protein